EKHVDAEFRTTRLLLSPGVSADHDDRQRASLVALADPLGRVEAVHPRQHPVEDGEAEPIRAAFAIVLLEERKALLGAADGHWTKRPAAKQHLEKLAARRRVLHDQDRPLRERRWSDASGHLLLRLGREAGGEKERRAGARDALEHEIAAHQTGQTA